LRVGGEQQFAVAPLATPASEQPSTDVIASAPAVRLFVERARTVQLDFVLDETNELAVATICRRLDGMPLAIELAAARVGLLPPAAMLRRLERRQLLLAGGGLDRPERHRTLQRTLDWSYELLQPAERRLFRRMAVFAGGCQLEALEAVCGDADPASPDLLDQLQELVDNSLVRLLESDGGERRVGLLETVREYAEALLIESGEVPTVRSRHRDWYVAWAEAVSPELTRADQVSWFRRLDDELGNFQAAREWCRLQPGGGEAELRLAAALGRYWWVRSPGGEGRAWLSEALAHAGPAPTAARARSLTWSGQFEYLYGDPQVGRSRLEQAVAVARSTEDRSLLSLALRHLALYCAEQPVAVSLLQEAVSIAGAAGDQRELAFGLAFLASAREWQGCVAEADALLAQAVAASRACGDAAPLTEVLLRVADRELTARRFDAAVAALQEALQVSQTIGFRNYFVNITAQLAWLALERHDLTEARTRVTASLEAARVSGTGGDSVRPLRVAAKLAVALGRYREGARLHAAVAAWRQRHDMRQDSTLWTHHRFSPAGDPEALSLVRANLDDQDFEAIWAEGEALSLPEALNEALAACQA
jgi:non-specific serine/threonine protein kinase